MYVPAGQGKILKDAKLVDNSEFNRGVLEYVANPNEHLLVGAYNTWDVGGGSLNGSVTAHWDLRRAGLDFADQVEIGRGVRSFKEMTEDNARTLLEAQIRLWKLMGWMFPAHLMEHLLKNTNADYKPTPEDRAEVVKHLQPMLEKIVEIAMARQSPFKLGDTLEFDSRVRWIPDKLTLVRAGQSVLSYEPQIANDYMFFAMGGADLTFRGKITRIDLRNDPKVEVQVDYVKLHDDTDFNETTFGMRTFMSSVYYPSFGLQIRNAYNAAHFLFVNKLAQKNNWNMEFYAKDLNLNFTIPVDSLKSP